MTATKIEAQQLLTNDEAAAYLRAAPATVNYWRATGQGPRYSKLGRRIVYTRSDLDAFVQACRVG